MAFAGVLRRSSIPQVVLTVAGAAGFGPVGTVADISYFDVNSDPQRVVGDVVAQGDSDNIGCRIVETVRSRPRGSRTK
jgi:Mycobacterium membrane protein